MTRTKLIPSIAAMSCLLLCLCVYSQEPGRSGVRASGCRLEVVEAEVEVKVHELELKMAELAVDEATVELEKIKSHLEAAEKQGDSREVGHIKLELKQAAIRVEMRKVECQVVRLRIELTRAILEHRRAALTVKPGKPTRVQLEYVDDLDIVVILGAKESVDKIKALIEGAEKEGE